MSQTSRQEDVGRCSFEEKEADVPKDGRKVRSKQLPEYSALGTVQGPGVPKPAMSTFCGISLCGYQAPKSSKTGTFWVTPLSWLRKKSSHKGVFMGKGNLLLCSPATLTLTKS